jgi:hypothetical protein
MDEPDDSEPRTACCCWRIVRISLTSLATECSKDCSCLHQNTNHMNRKHDGNGLLSSYQSIIFSLITMFMLRWLHNKSSKLLLDCSIVTDPAHSQVTLWSLLSDRLNITPSKQFAYQRYWAFLFSWQGGSMHVSLLLRLVTTKTIHIQEILARYAKYKQ